MRLAVVHAATEDAIAATGVLAGAAGDGRVSLVSRDDLAEAAAVVLTAPGPATAHELTGPAASSYDDLAALVAELTGKSLAHKSFTEADLLARHLAAGLPPFAAELLADAQNGIRAGRYGAVTPDLARLLGRPPVTVERVAAGLARH